MPLTQRHFDGLMIVNGARGHRIFYTDSGFWNAPAQSNFASVLMLPWLPVTIAWSVLITGWATWAELTG